MVNRMTPEAADSAVDSISLELAESSLAAEPDRARTADRRAAATVEHSAELDVLLMDEMEAELAPIIPSETQPDKQASSQDHG